MTPWRRSDRPFPWTAAYKVALVVCLVVAIAFAILVIADLLWPAADPLDRLAELLGTVTAAQRL